MLQIRAGKGILDLIRQEGLRAEKIAALVGPALGPRWMVTAGIDHFLARSRFLETGRKVTLSGASAGAWRMVALAQRDPVEALARFREAYVSMTFSRGLPPSQRSAVLRRAAKEVLPRREVRGILSHPCYELCLWTVRARRLLASPQSWLKFMGLAAATAFNAFHPRLRRVFMTPVCFYSGNAPLICGKDHYHPVRLTPANLKEALVASGSVPLHLEGVRNIPGAGRGVHYDGGLAHYVLNARYGNMPSDITLLIYPGGPFIPTWLDKKAWNLERRIPSVDNVLAVSPSPRFVERLPYGRIPHRGDWKTFQENPLQRIHYWNKVITLSLELGETFMELVESGKLREVVRPL